eukprot:CAMPEP_0174360410 /NCGR_PEP_ID=MMETSP0811_2-20130205/54030_1 /TAXON_ID=73025 ORGANISM="Eutreptiella gymnastica-like, Strain CCMP1594" /NCGR_SAMPLE_ID=MMETSP0811_2 /ASSEMBLY_ACC=CAM_ASM_000667 /LENGTH=46 /DNA_ID= /DNA_START= /DNA_END= /DNA_ORIENTATION=
MSQMAWRTAAAAPQSTGTVDKLRFGTVSGAYFQLQKPPLGGDSLEL